MKISKKNLKVLCIALCLILLGSIMASVFSSTNGVKVKKIKFDTDNGYLSGLLYMPKDASASNPKPTVIVTHGYLNSAEMQDANAIELSRRGYVVLALDQYDHGHSDFDNSKYSDTSFFGIWLPFWVNSMHDAVAYMYEQPYVLKDEAGNGIIGVTGHSMGGFGSTMALAMDEQEFMATGIRKIYCGLTEGSDFLYTGLVGVDAATADALGGGRTMGKVAAQFDEFFFNDPAETGGTVRHKDYVSTPDGMTFLQQTAAAQANTWYDTSDGGRRIIYEPAQTHPWNHFSKTTTAYALSFYTEAFKDYQDGIRSIDPAKQVWQWKEFFECVALVGFIMLIIGIASTLIELPFFSKANTGPLEVQPSPTGGKKVAVIIIDIIAILLPGLFFTPLMDGGAGSPIVNILFYCGIVAAIGGFACTLIALVIMSAVYVCIKSRDGAVLANYGVVLKPMAILAGICTAIVTIILAYIVLFLMDAIFKADFRIWTFAFKTFDANIIPAILRYLPTFLFFYLVSTASITVNTNTEKTQGFKGYLLAIALNAGGAILWLARQYITLFSTGVAAHPESALSGIVLVAMAVTLTIAAIISRNLYKKTGNIWTAACLNGILMTTMTIANTMVAFK